MKMKKLTAWAIASAVALAALAGCGAKGTAGKGEEPESASVTEAESSGEMDKAGRRLRVVTTIFPEYDWTREILGERAGETELSMLLDNGVDLHSYQPTAEDIMKIADCDLFVYVGGESDGWAEDALRESSNKDRKVIKLLDVLGDAVKEEELVEGMEAEHDHEHGEEAEEAEHGHEHDGEAEEAEHGHEHDGEAEEAEHGHEHGEEPEADEHVWLSLRNAKALCAALAEALSELDSENAELYNKNLAAYTAELDALDAEYGAAVDAASVKTLLFGDRFPFRYLVDDYGMNYYAAFVGCSAETEASFETISFLAGKTDELGLKSVMTIEGPNHKIAETIVQNTEKKDQKILTLDSMQATTAEDVRAGASYLGIMEKNLEVLKEALQS